MIRSANVLKPSTILDFHRILRNRKYRLLFSPEVGFDFLAVVGQRGRDLAALDQGSPRLSRVRAMLP